MTQEEKQLLLKELCDRLPYGVIYHRNDGANIELREIDIKNGTLNYTDNIVVRECKPYLRPMSSMTEKEKEELRQEHIKDEKLYAECLTKAANGDSSMRGKVILHFAADWCNKNHFDYRIDPSTGKTLIESNLAIEAPEGMYKKEESEEENEVPIPKTVDEAVKTLAKIVSKEDRDYIIENGAISVHDSMGRWIRNEWGLWTDSELKNELKKKGFEHPDDMSNYIIEEFIKYWNNKI